MKKTLGIWTEDEWGEGVNFFLPLNVKEKDGLGFYFETEGDCWSVEVLVGEGIQHKIAIPSFIKAKFLVLPNKSKRR